MFFRTITNTDSIINRSTMKNNCWIALVAFSIVISWFCLVPEFAHAGDRFESFSQLQKSTDCRENYDYTIKIDEKQNNFQVVVLAIHGGLIEPYTSELAIDVAQHLLANSYLFYGHATQFCGDYPESTNSSIYRDNFRNLHITSTKFDNRQAIKLVSLSSHTVAIHGYSPGRGYPQEVICIGGAKNNNSGVTEFINAIESSDYEGYPKLNAVDAREAEEGMLCGSVPGRFKSLGGSSKDNIVNQNSQQAWLQLEFHYDLLAELTQEGDRAGKYRELILQAIEQAVR